MSDRTLHCYDYVNQAYPRVRDAMLANPQAVFRHATTSSAHGSALHVRLGAIDIAADIAITITGIEQTHAYGTSATKLTLAWQAVSNPGLFPAMKATLLMFALSATETQLELTGCYEPPMGKLGEVLDAAAGHRVAEASVTRFVNEVASWLRATLTQPAATLTQPAAAVEPPPAPRPAGADAEC